MLCGEVVRNRPSSCRAIRFQALFLSFPLFVLPVRSLTVGATELKLTPRGGRGTKRWKSTVGDNRGDFVLDG